MLTGRLVTGIDRSYERSIYRCLGYKGFIIELECVSFMGIRYNGMYKDKLLPVFQRHKSQYRLASLSEIKKSFQKKQVVMVPKSISKGMKR